MTNCSQIDFWKRHKVWRLERPKSWANLKCYAFPPNFVKICSDKPLVILIAPVWKLISHAFATSDRSSNPIASERQSSYIASKSASSFETQLAWKIWRIWRSHADRGFSDEATKIISASWPSGTDKQYNSALKKWCCWCEHRRELIYFKQL